MGTSFGLSMDVIEKINDVLAEHTKIERCLIYGSRAKGNHKPGSDIDLTLEAPGMTLTELLRIENEIDELLLPYKIDLSLKHQIDNPNLLDHIARVGCVFYNRA